MSLMCWTVGLVSHEVKSFEAWKPSIAEQMLYHCTDWSQAWSCAPLQHRSIESPTPSCSLQLLAILSDQYLFRARVLGLLSASLYFYERLWPLIPICTPSHRVIDYQCVLLPDLEIASLRTIGVVWRCWRMSPKPLWLSSNLICCGHAGGWIDNGILLIDLPALALNSLK